MTPNNPIFGVKIDSEPTVVHIYHPELELPDRPGVTLGTGYSLCGRILRQVQTRAESRLPCCEICAIIADRRARRKP